MAYREPARTAARRARSPASSSPSGACDHPPYPPTGARRRHRDNGLMGRDMRPLWRDQPRVTLKVAVFDARTDDAFTNTGSLEELDAFVESDMRDLVGS